MRNALAHVPKGQHTMVTAAIRQAFLQADADAGHPTWLGTGMKSRHEADRKRLSQPRPSRITHEASSQL